MGGSGGGQFVARCPFGQYLTGFEAWVADDVDAIRPLCVTASGPTNVGPPEPQRKFGGDGGSYTRQLVCPADSPIVTGMYVESEGYTVIVNAIHLFCGVAATTQVQSEIPAAVFTGPRASTSKNRYQGPPTHDTQRCPAGTVAVGINGRSGVWLDAVGLICGVPKLPTKQQPPPPSPTGVGSLGRVSPPERSAYIYAVANDPTGTLNWFRHDGASSGTFAWQGPRTVNEAWSDFKQVFGGGEGVIYTLNKRGTLTLYQHPGFKTGVGRGDTGDWPPPKQLATGWTDVVHAFSTGEGVFYTITTDGTLNWYRYVNGTLAGPNKVGRGWTDVRGVFSIGGGVIYVIRNDGKLEWLRHNGYLTGEGVEKSGTWIGPKEVGSGWSIYQHVFSSGDGIIYGVAADGKLMWYRHRGFKDGTMSWEGPRQVGTGWLNLVDVFAQP
jgi:Tachylectin